MHTSSAIPDDLITYARTCAGLDDQIQIFARAVLGPALEKYRLACASFPLSRGATVGSLHGSDGYTHGFGSGFALDHDLASYAVGARNIDAWVGTVGSSFLQAHESMDDPTTHAQIAAIQRDSQSLIRADDGALGAAMFSGDIAQSEYERQQDELARQKEEQARQQKALQEGGQLADQANQNGFTDDVMQQLQKHANDPYFLAGFLNSLSNDRLDQAAAAFQAPTMRHYRDPDHDKWAAVAMAFATAYATGHVDSRVTQELENKLDSRWRDGQNYADYFLDALATVSPTASTNFVNQLTGDQLRAWENNDPSRINPVAAKAVAQNLDSYTGDGGNSNYTSWRGELLMHMATASPAGQAILQTALSDWVKSNPIPSGHDDDIRAWCARFGNLTSTMAAGTALAARHDAIQADETYTLILGAVALPTVFIPGGPAAAIAVGTAITLGQTAMQANNIFQPPDAGDAATMAYVKAAEGSMGVFINALCQNNMVVDSQGHILNLDQITGNLKQHPPDCYLDINFHAGSKDNYSLTDATGHIDSAFMSRLNDVASG